MPMLTTLRTGLPVKPVHSPWRTLSAKAPMRSSTSWTSGTTSWPSTTRWRSAGARRAVWRTARSSVRLMRTPANIVRPALLHAGRPRHRQQQRHRLVGDPVLAVVEEQAGALGGQALRALRVVGEQVPQVAVPDRGVVGQDRLPLGHPVEGGGNRRLVRAHGAIVDRRARRAALRLRDGDPAAVGQRPELAQPDVEPAAGQRQAPGLLARADPGERAQVDERLLDGAELQLAPAPLRVRADRPGPCRPRGRAGRRPRCR